MIANTVTTFAAGAVGALITLLAGLVVRCYLATREVAAHDRLIADLDEDLARWVCDEHERLKLELKKIRNELAARGMLQSGEYPFALTQAKERAVHRYRDQETRAERERRCILSREHLLHQAWRRIRRRLAPSLQTPEGAKPVIDTWLVPPTRHLARGDRPPPVNDPRARTLDETIQEIEHDQSAFQ